MQLNLLDLSPLKRRLILVGLCLLLYLPGLSTLPVMDRDEARYVQATKQMIETGNYFDIRFQEAPRYQKPIGIYWLQAASVKLFNQPLNNVWPYRLPSAVAMILAVLLLEILATILFTPRVGFTSALIFTGSVLPIIEAHLAKTDATLLLATVMSMGAMGVLLTGNAKNPWQWPLLFWMGLALGVLIKGPVLPAIVVLSLVAWCVATKSWRCVAVLKPVWGVPLFLVLTLPWVIMLHVKSNGQFWQSSLGGDILSKLSGGQESHGAPPSFYLLTSLLTLFPASLLILPSLKVLLKDWRQPVLLFCLCWAIPSWLFFELAPTKLVHYILPLFPPLMMLASSAPINTELLKRHFFRVFSTTLSSVLLLALLGGLFFSVLFFKQQSAFGEALWSIAPIAIFAIVLLIMAVIVLFKTPEKQTPLAMILPIGFAGMLTFLLASYFPSLSSLWLTNNIKHHVETTIAWPLPEKANQLVLVGYNEPSAVFELGTPVKLLDPEQAIQSVLNDPRPLAVFVSDGAFAHFQKGLALRGIAISGRTQNVRGFNYSKGKWVTLNVYVFN